MPENLQSQPPFDSGDRQDPPPPDFSIPRNYSPEAQESYAAAQLRRQEEKRKNPPKPRKLTTNERLLRRIEAEKAEAKAAGQAQTPDAEQAKANLDQAYQNLGQKESPPEPEADDQQRAA